VKSPLKIVPAALDESLSAAKGLTQLRPEDREALINKLAEILVLDYQQNQGVIDDTVKEGSHLNRRERQGKPTEKRGLK
jgi:hypothetical protein